MASQGAITAAAKTAAASPNVPHDVRRKRRHVLIMSSSLNDLIVLLMLAILSPYQRRHLALWRNKCLGVEEHRAMLATIAKLLGLEPAL